MFQYLWMVVIGIVVLCFIGYTIWTFIDTYKSHNAENLMDYFDWYYHDHDELMGAWVVIFFAATLLSFVMWLLAER